MEKDKNKNPKIVQIHISTLRQFFSKYNIRAIGFIILGIFCFIEFNELGSWGRTGPGSINYYAQDYPKDMMHNLSNIADNTYETARQLNGAFKYFFGILGGLFLILGITNFKFKK